MLVEGAISKHTDSVSDVACSDVSLYARSGSFHLHWVSAVHHTLDNGGWDEDGVYDCCMCPTIYIQDSSVDSRVRKMLETPSMQCVPKGHNASS
jgi:hypothetical protein